MAARQSAVADPEANGHGPAVAPIIEGPGRYVVYKLPDGGWLINRTAGICETCQGCGCGETADPIQVPGVAVAMAERMMASPDGKGRLMGLLGKAASRHG